MSRQPPFRLLTSVSPKLDAEGLAHQRACVASWRAAGFAVATVNGRAETARVAAYGLDLDVVEAQEDGKPSIQGMLDALRGEADRFAGLINADCAILPYPGLASRLRDGLSGRMAMVERVDVDADGAPQADTCSGFDAFFFDMDVLPDEVDRAFRIGVPWWDYLLPMAAARRGAGIVCVDTPLVTHRLHEQNWNHEELARVGEVFRRFLRDWRAAEPADFPFSAGELHEAKGDAPLDRTELEILSLACFRWLRAHRATELPLFPPGETRALGELLRAFRTSLNATQARFDEDARRRHLEFHTMKLQLEADMIESMKSIEKLTNDAASLASLLDAARKELDAVHASLSWRATRPLRELGRLAGRPRRGDDRSS